MSRARSVANLGNQSLNLGVSDGGLTVGTGVTIKNTGQSQFAGIITATKFIGDGSGLIDVTGTGVVIKHDGSTVGTAATIDFGTNLDVSALSAGIVTVTASGGSSGISSVVEDTTPQLGGNLDVNSKDITGTGNVNLSGVVTATSFSGNLTGNVSTGDGLGNGVNIGVGNDLQIYETSSDVGINYQRTGTLFIRSGGDTKIDKNGSARFLAHADGAVDLYYDGNKKLETTSSGVSVTGTLGATAVTGDGSALSGVVTSIVAGSNITLTGGPTGAITIAASGGGGGGGDTVSIESSATDILSVSSGAISADDAGADKLVFWDDSAGKLTYLTVGSNLTVTNTTIAASGGGGGGGGGSNGFAVIAGMIF